MVCTLSVDERLALRDSGGRQTGSSMISTSDTGLADGANADPARS